MRLILFLLLTCLLKQGFAQDDVKIIWHQDSLLKWSDFKGPIDESSNFSAVTYISVDYHVKWRAMNNKYTLSFTTEAYLTPSRSWTKVEKQTPKLLRHEQTHFDIAAFFSRILLIALKNHEYTASHKLETEQINKSIQQKKTEMQELYDKQTDHSKNEVMQAKWELYIARLLKEHSSLQDAIDNEPIQE